MRKKRTDSSAHDSNYVAAQLARNHKSEPHTGDVLCPCYAGWDAFEKNVRFVLLKQRAGTRAERAYALHVMEDAMRIQSLSDLQYALEPGEHLLDEKRACHFRSMEMRIEARREKLLVRRRRHKG